MNWQTSLKWIYTFVLLAATLWWARYCVEVIRLALATQSTMDILSVAGVSSLLGVLVTLNVNVNQHWFRKKTPEDENRR